MNTLDALLKSLGLIALTNDGQFRPLSTAEIDNLEVDLGVRLPEDYRTFLATYGASMTDGMAWVRPVQPLPEAVSVEGRAMFEGFYGYCEDRNSDDLRWNRRIFAERIPDDLLAIGGTGTGHKICLRTSGEHAGQVYLWDLRSEPLTEEEYLEDYGEPMPPEAKYANVYLLAGSFSDFLARIEVEREDEG